VPSRAPQSIAISAKEPAFLTAPTMERRVIVTPGPRLTRSNSFTFRPTGTTEGLLVLPAARHPDLFWYLVK
jgi:hypothetical protein